jgi:hypothetical protein
MRQTRDAKEGADLSLQPTAAADHLWTSAGNLIVTVAFRAIVRPHFLHFSRSRSRHALIFFGGTVPSAEESVSNPG